MKHLSKNQAAGGPKPAAFFLSLRIACGFALGIAAVLFSGCSGNPPEILKTRWRLTAFEDREKNLVYEYLSVAILPSDEDGQEDLESFSVLHDGAELYWQIFRDRWTKRQVQQESWIGADTLTTADYSPLPRGKYRVVLKDYSGSQAESVFQMTLRAEPPKEFPSLRLEGDRLVLLTEKEGAVLLIKSAPGALIGSFSLKRGPNLRDDILSNAQVKNQAKHLYLYQFGEEDSYALVSGPYEASDFLFSR